MLVDVEQPGEPTSTPSRVGAFEYLLGAVFAAILGFGLDVIVDRLPLFTLLFGLAGLAVSGARIYTGYRRERAQRGRRA